MKKIIYLLMIVFSVSLTAQSNVRVEEFVINGSLKKSDPVSAGLGRINAIKLNLKVGDRLYSKLTADFVPLLVLVPPSGVYKITYPDEKTFAATYNGIIDEPGQWLIYIVGDSTATGNYTLLNKYASVGSMNFNNSLDYCDRVNLLLSHEKAHFFFLKGKEIDDSGIWESKINLENDVAAEIYGNKNEYFKTTIFKSSNYKLSKSEFTYTADNIAKCLGSGWTKRENDWHNVLGNDNVSQKIILFAEKSKDKRYVKIILSKNKKTKEAADYTISLIISDLR